MTQPHAGRTRTSTYTPTLYAPAPPLGRPEAAVVHWSPNAPAPAPKSAQRGLPAGAPLRMAVPFVAAGVLAGLHHPVASCVALALALLTAAFAVWSPGRLYVAQVRAVERLTDLVTTALTWLVVGLAWVLILTPLGLFLRRRDDPLGRARGPQFVTYWKARPEGPRPQNRPF